MANRPKVLLTPDTSPETPIQFAACRNVGRAILPADPLSSGSSRLERRLRPGLAAPHCGKPQTELEFSEVFGLTAPQGD